MSADYAKCFAPAQVRGLTLRNRLIKAATFEGMTPGGVPTAALTRMHRRLGEGGIALTNIGYCAAESDGRIDDNMMYMHEGVRAPLERLITEVHETGAAVMGQLGHAGTFTKNPLFKGQRPLGPSRAFSPIGITVGRALAVAMTTDQIRERVRVFGRAAAFMKSVGFDAIEVHFGHGYGISQFISPLTNKRKDAYGGALHNRMRFALEVLAEVRAAVGDDFPLFGKISMTDGVPGGVSYEDSLEIAALLERGGLDVIICSGGTSSFNPMLLFRGTNIRDGIMRTQKSAFMKLGVKLAGGMLFKDYPYEELFFLEHARRIRERVSCGVCYVGGATNGPSFEALMAEGFDFVQLGRALLYDPDLPKHAAADPSYVNGCSHCNECAVLIEDPDGIRCVERPDNFA
ncbi:MAG: NADH:flavin oxidoreductase [Polyangiales bacterium]|nr:NADH:flavin oxidoreductase [Myxococcales bacterium]MCB9659960.1 NADH:flavin oxidoreductase [Sandaracinaceae bacterium]